MAEKKKILFTREEKELLLGLAQKYKHIVESKESDVISKADKAKCWIQIQEDYNSMAGNTKVKIRIIFILHCNDYNSEIL
jgi:hypothetical protein